MAYSLQKYSFVVSPDKELKAFKSIPDDRNCFGKTALQNYLKTDPPDFQLS